MRRTTTPSAAASDLPGAKSPTFMLPRAAVSQAQDSPQACVGEDRHDHGIAGLDVCIRPLTSLSREEVADLARNAADNCVPLPRANVFEPGSERASWFNAAYWKRDWELRAIEA